jgi:hypothetical protein
MKCEYFKNFELIEDTKIFPIPFSEYIKKIDSKIQILKALKKKKRIEWLILVCLKFYWSVNAISKTCNVIHSKSKTFGKKIIVSTLPEQRCLEKPRPFYLMTVNISFGRIFLYPSKRNTT